MKKVLAIVLALAMVLAFAACTKKEDPKVDPNAKSEGSMTFAAYTAAEEGSDVTVEGFITGMSYAQKYGNCNLFVQDGDGAYFVYRMPCTDDDAAKLVVGQKVVVKGVKTSWSGEVELKEGLSSYSVVDATYTFEPVDVTAKFGTDALLAEQNKVVKIAGATVKEAPLYKWDGSGSQGDDIYLTVTVNGADYSFVVETDVADSSTEVYKTVEGLKAGQTIDIEGFLYWYNAPQTWMTKVTVK